MRKKSLPEWDDGRTIVSMNVPGMPGYRAEQKNGGSSGVPFAATKRETWWIIKGALRAALFIGAIFALVIIGFSLLITLW